jgi:hypothetical protein
VAEQVPQVRERGLMTRSDNKVKAQHCATCQKPIVKDEIGWGWSHKGRTPNDGHRARPRE